MKQLPLKLTAEAFDALHIGSLALGGIGRGARYDFYAPYNDNPVGTAYPPLCAAGILEVAGMLDELPLGSKTGRYVGDENDRAVARINRRRKKPINTRVPFGAFVKEMNIDIKESA